MCYVWKIVLLKEEDSDLNVEDLQKSEDSHLNVKDLQKSHEA